MSILNRKSLANANYFEDYFTNDYAKGYRQLLFNPGKPVPARDLTQLQTMLNEYSKNYLDTVFRNGTVIEGCSLYIESNNHILTINKGLVYFDGTVYKLESTDKYPITYNLITGTTELDLFIKVGYEIAQNNNDGSAEADLLLDPAVKYFKNEAVMGADRLKMVFSLMDKSDVYPANDQYFDFATIKLVEKSPNVFEITDIVYLNRDASFVGVNQNKDYTDEIIDGLNIQTSNVLDYNTSFVRGDTFNDNFDYLMSNSIVDIVKGVGKVNGNYVPVAKNTIFELEKPIRTDTETNSEVLYYFEDKPSDLEGVYFKYYINGEVDTSTAGYPYNKFDP